MIQSTTTLSFVPAGSIFAAELRWLLRSLDYNPASADFIMNFVDRFGTASASAAEVQDIPTINALVVRHTAHIEYESAADWPAVYGALPDDDDAPTPDFDPEPGPGPSENRLAPDYEPSHADRAYWAMTTEAEARVDHELDRLECAGAALVLLTAPAPICGGSPADSKPIKLARWDDADGHRSRPARGWTDRNQYDAHGCV